MRIEFHRQFVKQYKKLSPRDKKAVDATIAKFSNSPLDPSLYNHPLLGDMTGYRSISAGFDLRIIFREFDDYTVVMLIKVGSHNQLYG